MHEGLGVLREEYMELENEIFFGEKRMNEYIRKNEFFLLDSDKLWKEEVRKEAVQVAAMACRIIQELT